MKEKRIPLTKTTSAEDFRAWYWLKSELQAFCREYGLPQSGAKQEIAERIAAFLATGVIKKAAKKRSRTTSPSQEPFSMDTPVSKDFTCSRQVRQFFESVLGPTFRFTVLLQKFIKAHPGITFDDIAAEWKRQEKLKKAGKLNATIAPQFEYNQFTQDFFADPKNAGKTRQDCIAAWKKKKSRPLN